MVSTPFAARSTISTHSPSSRCSTASSRSVRRTTSMVVCTFDRVASIPSTVLARCPQRWVFHLTDPLDASALGSLGLPTFPGPAARADLRRLDRARGAVDGRLGRVAVLRRWPGAGRRRVHAGRGRCLGTAAMPPNPVTTRCCRSACGSATVESCVDRRARWRARADRRPTAIGSQHGAATNGAGVGHRPSGRLVASRRAAAHGVRRRLTGTDRWSRSSTTSRRPVAC